jgi:DNA polymerase III sliding clamp (beta) subunit (PCNA family)
MIISRLILIDAIKAVAPAVKKSTLPSIECVRLECTSGTLRADATCLDMGLALKISAGMRTVDFLMLVPLHPIIDILPTLVGDDVELDIDQERWRLTIKAGPAKTVLPLMDPGEFPAITEFPKEQPGFDPTLISSMLFAASTDEARPLLTCAIITCKEHILTAWATNGFRISRCIADYRGSDFKAQIPAAFLNHVMRWDNVSFSTKDNGQILVGNQYHMLISSQVEGTPADYTVILPKTKKGSLEISSHSLSTALKQAGFVAKDTAQQLHLETVDGALKVWTENADEGKHFETILTLDKCDGQIHFVMNAAMMAEAISRCGLPLTISWIDKKSPIVIKPAMHEKWLYVQMPMHLG